MNLNDSSAFLKLDPSNMLAQIDGLPDQLANAWKLGNTLALPTWGDIERVLIAGMGGSAIGADLLSAYVSSICQVPVVVHRDYDLPAWASGSKTLVIICLIGLLHERFDMFVDIAFVYVILNFIGTVMISKYFETDKDKKWM